MQSVVWDYRVISFGYDGYGLCRLGAGSAGVRLGLQEDIYIGVLDVHGEVVVQKC